jgi:hypothetical protein
MVRAGPDSGAGPVNSYKNQGPDRHGGRGPQLCSRRYGVGAGTSTITIRHAGCSPSWLST